MTTELQEKLKDRQNELFCYLCNSSNVKIKFSSRRSGQAPDSNVYCCTSFGHNSHGDIIECQDCGLMTLKELPTPSDLEDMYKEVNDPLYIEERKNRYLTFNNVIGDMNKYVTNGRLLDIGCYCGYFLDVADSRGFDVQGIELSKWACSEVRKLGYRVHNDNLSSLELDNYFDVITLWDVIEHFSDPAAELKEINRLLKKGGYFFIATIDSGSLAARMMGPRWPWLMDMHIFYFNKKTLTTMLEQQGFTVVKIQTYTHYVSSQYLIQKLNHISKFGALLPRVLQYGFGDFNIPFNIGDNMMVIARKL